MGSAECRKTISFNSLRRAKRTVQDFCLTYFPLHGMSPLEFLEHWDTLVFVEATIYEVDEDVERAAAAAACSPAACSPALTALRSVLDKQGLMAGGVSDELQNGLQYWEEECRLGMCMLRHPVVPSAGHRVGFSLEDAHNAAGKKSFDYRLLNHLLYAIRKSPPPPALLAFLSIDETLLDHGDDLVDYEDDVLSNSFNIYRLYVHLFGHDAPLRLIEHISSLEERHARLLGELPPAQRQQILRRRAEAAKGEGALRWVMPNPILNELRFRLEHGSEDSGGSG